MTELERAARALLDACGTYRICYEYNGGSDIKTGRAWDIMRRREDALRAALEAEAWWETIKLDTQTRFDAREYRIQCRPLVDYSRDQALHAHEGDGDICSRCGEHRSWHDE